MHFLLRFAATTRDYLRLLRESKQEVALPLALAAVILTCGDRLVVWAIARAAPGEAAQIEAWGPGVTMLVFGLVPALAFLVWLAAPEWKKIWRRHRDAGKARDAT